MVGLEGLHSTRWVMLHPLREQRSSKLERDWSQYNMIHICSISVKKCAFLGGGGRWEL